MVNAYQIAKFWHSFWQRYNLRSQFRNIKKLFLFLFIVWMSGSLLTILSQYFFNDERNESLGHYLEYFWIVIIELVSGFDIPGEDLHLTIDASVDIGSSPSCCAWQSAAALWMLRARA